MSDAPRDTTPPVPSPLPPERLVESMATGWQPRVAAVSAALPQARFHRVRRERVSARFPGAWIVIPTGVLKVRANDTDYRFRPGTDFAWLTGYHEADAVLVMEPRPEGGHATVVYAREVPPRATKEYFTDTRNSELWVGGRLTLDEVALALDITALPLGDLEHALKRIEDAPVHVVRGFDALVDGAVPTDDDGDAELVRHLADLRLIKDEHEIACLEDAVRATVLGFEDVVRALADSVVHGSERWVEGTFNRRARTEGNDVGYETIAACGSNACSLHWIRNDGPVSEGDLLLLDAGVEGPELYTADVTRTIPVSGRYSPVQREVYDVVWKAQQAGIAACRPGNRFLDPHVAAMRVITEWLVSKRILTCTVEEALADDARLYQRYTLHGTSHMLGLDVHDCAASRDTHRGGALVAGMVLTVEPGCYLRPDDLTVPEEFRGIGVRIEDDVLITPDGHRVLSAALPTRADEVETWMARLRG